MTALLPAPGEPDACYLVDLSGWTRPCHAMGGEEAVVRGVVGKLVRLLVDQAPAYLGFAADLPGHTWHRDLWPGYHATRTDPGPGYWAAQDVTIEVLRLHRIPVWSAAGFAADDLLAAAVRRARAAGLRVVIVSRDHDLWQLLDAAGNVIAWDGDGVVTGAAEARAAHEGLDPGLLRDLFAFTGGKEQAPGVPGVGAKTGARLLKRYGGEGNDPLEAVLRYGPAERGKVGEALREHADAARLGRRLATLRDDAPFEWSLEELAVGWSEEDAVELRRRGAELGIRSMQGVEPMPKPKSRWA